MYICLYWVILYRFLYGLSKHSTVLLQHRYAPDYFTALHITDPEARSFCLLKSASSLLTSMMQEETSEISPSLYYIIHTMYSSQSPDKNYCTDLKGFKKQKDFLKKPSVL